MKCFLFKLITAPYITAILFTILILWRKQTVVMEQPMFCFFLSIYILCGVLIASLLNSSKEQKESKACILVSSVQLLIILIFWLLYAKKLIYTIGNVHLNSFMYLLLVFGGVYMQLIYWACVKKYRFKEIEDATELDSKARYEEIE